MAAYKREPGAGHSLMVWFPFFLSRVGLGVEEGGDDGVDAGEAGHQQVLAELGLGIAHCSVSVKINQAQHQVEPSAPVKEGCLCP